MSRSGYCDDYDGADLHLYRGRVASATRGKRGQKFFRDLIEALDAMSDKRLIKGELENPETGLVCAIGSLGKVRGIDMSSLDPEDAERVGEKFDIAECLARETVFENDENDEYRVAEGVCPKCHGWGEAIEPTRFGPSRFYPAPMRCSSCQSSGRKTRRLAETPEQRWQRMRDWAQSNIRPGAAS